MEKNRFKNLALKSHMLEVIHSLNFKQPTEIQEKAIPAILQGKDVIGQSQTGSGKTHAYLLPIMQMIDEDNQTVQFVITAPTRELARQIYDEIRHMIALMNKEHQWFIRLLVGGTDKERLKEKLKRPPHIIVGTPSRILDFINEGVLSIYQAKSFVIDEADLMFDLGFIKDVDRLLVRCREDIQVLVFSATIPDKLSHFFKKYLKNPSHIKVAKQLSPETMEHLLIAKRHRNEAEIIFEISKVIQPYLAIIFTNGKEEADLLGQELIQRGLNVGILHGGLQPRVRKRIVNDIQNLRYQYIVATDLISRGIDIEGISHVINAQLPKEEHFYIHRVGRTARINMEGTAISIYDDSDYSLLEKLERKGLTFRYVDVRNKTFVEAKHWDRRKRRRRKKSQSVDQEAWSYVKKPKKVKPGYRKKMKKQQEQIKKKLQSKNRKRNHRR
ncbi:ATP-dependent RNA helicase CshB [Cerasibacillus quisquiliarum]|uniref:DEAD-box ATP-dependent RNA helicase CshB n=1 Tax=Cerasibacillus quisquiliarum TaxID=227865 RepID=A0A511UWV8_9BACI|nr:DEAD/DEAH box helicase [Cerasibacillus quisquiliarum]MBB5145521.1 ATP-dependent RNA helicase CshB [Cerasibacillus quisquiliarum]GEN31084.1 DEAD-box ATP-dependent RNA helicase CshB [Cerasibacillus quisquiliarum]